MPEVLVALLPTPRSGREVVAGTVRSILDDAGDRVSVVACGDDPSLGIDGVNHMDPAALVEPGRILAFARIGDRWRAGAFASRLRTFAAHPTAGISVAGHAVVGADRREVLLVRAPTPPLVPAELLLRPRTEPSAVLVRSELLDPSALELLGQPHGDAVVWNRIAQEHGLLPSAEIAADVPLDPDRHGYAPEAAVAGLAQMLSASGWIDGQQGSRLRRELLQRWYIDLEAGLDEPGDLTQLLGHADQRTRTLIADLQWALERLRQALVTERVQWPGWTESTTGVQSGPALELQRLQHEANWLHEECAYRDAAIKRLQAEIALRDATVEQLKRALERPKRQVRKLGGR